MADSTSNFRRLTMQAPGVADGLRLNRRGDRLLVREEPCVHGLQSGADLGLEGHLVEYVFLQVDSWRDLYQFKALALNPEHRSFCDQQCFLASCCDAGTNRVG